MHLGLARETQIERERHTQRHPETHRERESERERERHRERENENSFGPLYISLLRTLLRRLDLFFFAGKRATERAV